MTIERANPGDRVLGPQGKLTAEAFNAFVDAALAFKQKDPRATQLRTPMTEACLFPVLNTIGTTGDIADRFSIVGLTEPIILPSVNLDEFKSEIAFRVRIPTTSDTGGRFAILQEPLMRDAIGLAAIAGCSVCKVYAANSTEESYRFADAIDGEPAHLGASAAEGVPVLYRQAGTGAQWAIVRLGAVGGEPVFKVGVLDDDLVYGATATMSVYTGSQLGETDSGEDITVSAPWQGTSVDDTVPAGVWGAASWNGFAWYFHVAPCPTSSS